MKAQDPIPDSSSRFGTGRSLQERDHLVLFCTVVSLLIGAVLAAVYSKVEKLGDKYEALALGTETKLNEANGKVREALHSIEKQQVSLDGKLESLRAKVKEKTDEVHTQTHTPHGNHP